MRPVVYSASSLNAYIDCHLRWYFIYVLLEEEAESEARAVGIAVHDFAEQRLKVLQGTATEANYEGEDITPLVMVFNRDILPTYENPVLIEAPFQIEVNGIPFSGIIDSLDEQQVDWSTDTVYVLRDLKTTSQRPSKGRYRLNMTGYWVGATSLGYRPDVTQLDYVVRTRKPYYWPEVLDPITDDDVDVLAATLSAVARGVESEDYRPTGLGTLACSYCGYKAICGPYQRYQEATNPIREDAR